jgi:hypothetical protein
MLALPLKLSVRLRSTGNASHAVEGAISASEIRAVRVLPIVTPTLPPALGDTSMEGWRAALQHRRAFRKGGQDGYTRGNGGDRPGMSAVSTSGHRHGDRKD